MFSLDCYLVDIKGQIPIQYMRLIWSFVVPILYLLILLASFVFIKYIKKQKVDVNVLICGLLFLYIYYQPNLSLQFIGVISCRKISGHYWIQSQMDKLCYTVEHNAWLISFITPALFILIILIPGFLFYKLSN